MKARRWVRPKHPRAGTGRASAATGEEDNPSSLTETLLDGYYANYTGYSTTLRAWLVAYGIGGPVLFLTSDAASKRLAEAGNARSVISLFLIGVALQVAGTLINKWAAWHVYSRLNGAGLVQNCWSTFWCWVNDQTWIDFGVDLLSIAAFGTATWMLLDVFLSMAPVAH